MYSKNETFANLHNAVTSPCAPISLISSHHVLVAGYTRYPAFCSPSTIFKARVPWERLKIDGAKTSMSKFLHSRRREGIDPAMLLRWMPPDCVCIQTQIGLRSSIHDDVWLGFQEAELYGGEIDRRRISARYHCPRITSHESAANIVFQACELRG